MRLRLRSALTVLKAVSSSKVGITSRSNSTFSSPKIRSTMRVKGLMKARKIRVVITLNARWTLASITPGSTSKSFNRPPNANRNGSASTTPPTLNSTWLSAVFFAAKSMFTMAINAVTVVPMLAPMMSGTALSRLSRPCWVKMIASPVVTALDCTTAVNTQPASTASRMFWGRVR